MGKLIQVYAVVCVTIDAETGKAVDLELSDASEMPMDADEVWDIEEQEWVTPDDIDMVADEATTITSMAIQALKNANRAQKEIARWEACGGALNDGRFSGEADPVDAHGKGAAWMFKDGSILLVTNEGIPMEAH